MTTAQTLEDTDVAAVRAKRLRDVALGYRLLAANRWGDAGDGHISARDPERLDCFWTAPYGLSYHRVTVDALILVGPDGALVEGSGPLNEAAYHIHYPILRTRPDAVSACHVHTGWGTPFSAECRPVEPITQEACMFFEDHALFDDEEVQVQSVEAGQRIADALGDNRAIVLRSHGLLTVGVGVPEAVGGFIQLERVCEAHMKARDAKPLSPEGARFAKQDLERLKAHRGAFFSMVDRHVGDRNSVV